MRAQKGDQEAWCKWASFFKGIRGWRGLHGVGWGVLELEAQEGGEGEGEGQAVEAAQGGCPIHIA